MTIPTSVGQQGSHIADQAAQSADAAIQTARKKAHDAMDEISDKMKSVKDQAAETLERFRPQLDAVTSYAREEPTKALLIAAAAGAGIMGLVALMARSSGGGRMPSGSSLRRAAADAADSMRQAASDSIDRLRKAAQDSADSARQSMSAKPDDVREQAPDTAKSARGTAKGVYDSLSDTVAQWRDQAQPLVERIRPQLDNVMDYAKEDPGKALLLAATAGAALMGLVSTLKR
jgi:ElaB/YqjD/DUF883 family membrane-anchored ribosome-binding protein